MLKLKHPFEPLHFLNALGAGGISVSFFMYFMFLTEHPDTIIPTFDTIATAFLTSNALIRAMIILAYAGLILFALFHFYLIVIKTRAYLEFRQSERYTKTRQTNAEVQLMAIPLAYAVTMNVAFVLVVTLMPHIWQYIEYALIPSIVGYLIIGFFSLRTLFRYYHRLFLMGNFNFDSNNHLAQLIAAFSVAMVGVGFAGPAAISQTQGTATLALILSIGFISIAVMIFGINFITSFRTILEKGWMKESSPSIWNTIPFLSLVGISLIRYQHSFETVFHTPLNTHAFFFITIPIIAIQIMFGFFGYILMKENGYFKSLIEGENTPVGSLALICPGMAATVFGFFALHRGLVDNGLLGYNVIYFIILAILIAIQWKTIAVYLRLNRGILERT